MSFSFYIFRGSWRNVSDYIVSSGNIPFISKNQNSSLTAKGFSFDISESFGVSDIEAASMVRIQYNSVDKFVGKITKTKKNYKNHTYKLDVSDYLINLKDHYITYANLHTGITATPTYEASDSLTAPNVNVIELVKLMFEEADLDLDIATNGVLAQTVVNAKTVLGANDGGVPQSEDFTFADIRVDENMLYAINQSFATDHTVVSPDFYLTYFDFVSWVCSYLGLVVYQKEETEYYLDRSTSHGSYSINDNDTFDLDINEQKARGDYSISYRAGARLDYQDTVEDPIEEIRSIEDGTPLKSFGGLILLLIDQSFGTPSANDLYPMVYSAVNGTGFLTTEDKTTGNFYIGQRMKEYYDKALTVTTTITNPTVTYQDVLLNEFDLKNRTSKIKELS